MTSGERTLAFGLAMYAMSDAPSAPFTSGVETAMRGSSTFTVTPSVVAAAGGVAYGPDATKPGLVLGALEVTAVGTPVAVAVGAALGDRSHAARMVVAAAALPAIRVTRLTSSRRVISPSR